MSLLQWLRTSCDTAWKRHARFLLGCWVAGLVVCLIAAWLGGGLHYFLDYREDGRRFSGIMSLASGFCLLACGWSLLVPARRAIRSGHPREVLGWLLGSLGCVWLAFDEVAQFHEPLSHWLAREGVPRPLGLLDHDLYIFGAYAVGLALTLWLLWPFRRPLEPVMLPLSVALVCFALSEMVDQFPWDLMNHNTQQWVGTTEEIFKTLGTWTLAVCGLMTADEATGGSGSPVETLPSPRSG